MIYLLLFCVFIYLLLRTRTAHPLPPPSAVDEGRVVPTHEEAVDKAVKIAKRILYTNGIRH